MAKDKRYLTVEQPDTAATVDFLGTHPVSVRLSLVNGQLHVYAVSATEDAPILVDEVVTVPQGDSEEEE